MSYANFRVLFIINVDSRSVSNSSAETEQLRLWAAGTEMYTDLGLQCLYMYRKTQSFMAKRKRKRGSYTCIGTFLIYKNLRGRLFAIYNYSI